MKNFHNSEIQRSVESVLYAAWMLIPLEVREVLKGRSQGNVRHENVFCVENQWVVQINNKTYL